MNVDLTEILPPACPLGYTREQVEQITAEGLTALWDALVDHVHADAGGNWHGNNLDREDTESWLADEAGRIPPP